MVSQCKDIADLVEERIDRIATQYRESPHILGVIRNYLGEIAEAYDAICTIPDYFDLDTSIGDQLTIIGKVLGWPRCHCVCFSPAIFGFCKDSGYEGPLEIIGFCEDGTWIDCEEIGEAQYCFNDDELYRRFLKVVRYQFLGLYDMESLQQAVKLMWGDLATVFSLGGGNVILSPGRALTEAETNVIQLAFRVFPIAPGVKAWLATGNAPVFGFGSGWTGFCGPDMIEGNEDDPVWLCYIDPKPYTC